MASFKVDEAKETAAIPAQTTSASADKKPTYDSKQASTPRNSHESEKQKKKAKSNQAGQHSQEPGHHEKGRAKDQAPAKRQARTETDAPKELSKVTESSSKSRSTDSKHVHFAMDVKKGDGGSSAISASPNSSNESWIDPPPTKTSTSAQSHRSSFKSKGDTDAPTSALNPKLSEVPVGDPDFDVWSDDSDEGSAIDISDVPTMAMPSEQPALRGILKTRGRSGQHPTNRFRKKTTLNRARQASPEPLTFTSKNLERAKRSGYEPTAVHVIGRENRHGPSFRITRRHERDASLRSWSGRSEHGSATDHAHWGSKARTDAEDYRVEMALKQARSNGSENKRTSTAYTLDERAARPRSALKSMQNPNDGHVTSGRLEPRFMFRPSDAEEDDPGIEVRTQSELDAARKEYFRRRKMSS